MKKSSSLFAALSFALALAMPMSAFAVGAIAVDDEEGDTDVGYGIVTGMSSEKEAKAGAMKECKASGNKNCTVAVWFKECGAYANSRKYSGIGYGKTKQIAEQKALSECGDKACKVVISDCE